MKYPIAPKVLIALFVAVVFFGILALSVVDPDVILDFFKRITPDTDGERSAAILLLTALGAVIMYFVLRHTRPQKYKGKKN